ncbi:MAG: hypothetical protein NW224_00210 [Leptolyngbyaceae cyanobacterium bins.302]|nr:hypothetical protein [Leptolyngbyaceae cyanobacterium bins.302]
MADYTSWNTAIASYFVSGVPRGSRVYLGVDDEALNYIGRFYSLALEGDSWSQDFRKAVRQQVVRGTTLDPSSLWGFDSAGLPKCVAFLGAMVLAAYSMAEGEAIDQNNYFRRFREILELPTSEEGRPFGLDVGIEEEFWLCWKRWLNSQGFLSSASRGEGPTTYIQYPISQSLLRVADKERLRNLFQDRNWKAKWDSEALFSRVRHEAPRLTRHLKRLLEGNRQRHSALAEAIHYVYENFQEQGIEEYKGQISPSTSARNIFSGLYRVEDPFLGNVEYYLYPKQIRGLNLEHLQVQYQNQVQTLHSDRPGWYTPSLPTDVQEIEAGIRYTIVASHEVKNLILPQREFWLLVPDPEDVDTSVFASWGSPSLGDKFILLCQKSLLKDLQLLRDEKLLEWYGEPCPVEGNPNWIELHQCMVVSASWSGVFIQNRELYEALSPTTSLSINISSGLRVPGLGGWLVEQGPKVTISSFHPKANIKITRLSTDRQVLDQSVEANKKLSINWSKPGEYLIEASSGGDVSERLIRIIDWEELPIQVPVLREKTVIGSWQVCGSLIEPVNQPVS